MTSCFGLVEGRGGKKWGKEAKKASLIFFFLLGFCLVNGFVLVFFVPVKQWSGFDSCSCDCFLFSSVLNEEEERTGVVLCILSFLVFWHQRGT